MDYRCRARLVKQLHCFWDSDPRGRSTLLCCARFTYFYIHTFLLVIYLCFLDNIFRVFSFIQDILNETFFHEEAGPIRSYL